MKKKKIVLISVLAALAVAAALIVVLVIVPNTGGEDDFYSTHDSDITEENAVYHEEEEDDAEVKIVKSNISDYYGTWKADSALAKQSYGNVEITVMEGGVWTGNITDTDLKGAWTETDNGLALTSELFDCTLSFTDTGTLVMIEDTGEEYADDLVTVLTKQ